VDRIRKVSPGITKGISLKNHTHEAGSLVAGATAVTGTTGGAI